MPEPSEPLHSPLPASACAPVGAIVTPDQAKPANQLDLTTSSKRAVPLALRVYGVLALLNGIAAIPLLALVAVGAIAQVGAGHSDDRSAVAIAVLALDFALTLASTALFAVLGVRLLRNRRRYAARIAYTLIAVQVGLLLSSMMLNGLGAATASHAVVLTLTVVLSGYLDPALAEERLLQRKLHDLDIRAEAERGTLGRDVTGEGYLALNFFNLFWIFAICSVVGLALEVVYHFMLFGGYEDRAGLLFGPFSPIYGFGGVLVTVALNRFYRAPLPVVFAVSAVIGGAFEFFVSWFLQTAFGITAWDYTGTFLSIGGRTNAQFMIMWGLLGLAWVRLLLPRMLKLVNLIPWNWRYVVTTACATLMVLNGALTLAALDRWYSRLADAHEPSTALEWFCDEHFDNRFMERRFQSMSINPHNAVRETSAGLGSGTD
ncbi:putative ABC transporter permease [Berryella wangjianweii]|uniref:putative ABC transporter permease n=1 Tax=Berryella wangjianweii TaxID=2734634 RepID=UPI0021BDB75B|nr:putative ABC transporter permease [Berryella wangjianweii]